MLSHLLTHQAMRFCSSPLGIARDLAKSSRVLISHHWLFIICLIGAVVKGISLLWWCYAECAFSSHCWNSFFHAIIHKIWKAAPWGLDSWYACLRSIIALSGSLVLAFMRWRSWRIWSEKWLSKCILTTLKTDLFMRWYALSKWICIVSQSMRWCVAVAKRLILVGWLSCSSW